MRSTAKKSTKAVAPDAVAKRLWSEVEFLALPETNRHVELIDGEVVRESPTLRHQACVGSVFEQLNAWARGRVPVPTVALSPLDIRFAPGRILQPDVSVFLEPLPLDSRMPIERIPDLCVEIVSGDRKYDRSLKREVYADAGVREYWTVVPSLRFAERWTGSRLATREECRESLASLVLEGFTLDVAALLRE